MRAKVPNHPVAVFLFGIVWIGIAGWMAGMAYRDWQSKSADADAMQRGRAQADGWVYFSYDDPDGGYDVGYNFRVPSGQIYVGSFPSKVRRAEGERVRVVYAESDPMVSYEFDSARPGTPFPFYLLPIGFGLLGLYLLGKLALSQAGASTSVKQWFVVSATFGSVTMACIGLMDQHLRYTVQVGDTAWESWAFDRPTWIPGVSVQLDDRGLWVGDRYCGAVPNHGHVWIRGDEVLVNGKVLAR